MVVQRMDNTIQRTNCYPADKCVEYRALFFRDIADISFPGTYHWLKLFK